MKMIVHPLDFRALSPIWMRILRWDFKFFLCLLMFHQQQSSISSRLKLFTQNTQSEFDSENKDWFNNLIKWFLIYLTLLWLFCVCLFDNTAYVELFYRVYRIVDNIFLKICSKLMCSCKEPAYTLSWLKRS